MRSSFTATIEHQALVLSQLREGTLWLRYLPVTGLAGRGRRDSFSPAAWAAGFPLRLFEDPDLRVDGDRASLASQWHPEREWFDAIHRTRYSNGVIGLHEMFQRWQPQSIPPPFQIADKPDWPVLRRFVARRRELTEADLLILRVGSLEFQRSRIQSGGKSRIVPADLHPFCSDGRGRRGFLPGSSSTGRTTASASCPRCFLCWVDAHGALSRPRDRGAARALAYLRVTVITGSSSDLRFASKNSAVNL